MSKNKKAQTSKPGTGCRNIDQSRLSEDPLFPKDFFGKFFSCWIKSEWAGRHESCGKLNEQINLLIWKDHEIPQGIEEITPKKAAG